MATQFMDTITEAFQTQAEKAPDKIAVEDQHRSLTHKQLDQLSSAIMCLL